MFDKLCPKLHTAIYQAQTEIEKGFLLMLEWCLGQLASCSSQLLHPCVSGPKKDTSCSSCQWVCPDDLTAVIPSCLLRLGFTIIIIPTSLLVWITLETYNTLTHMQGVCTLFLVTWFDVHTSTVRGTDTPSSSFTFRPTAHWHTAAARVHSLSWQRLYLCHV